MNETTASQSDSKKILIVEDEYHIAEGLKLNLSLNGHQVKIAKNGVEGLEEFAKWSPDLIVLDLMMPQLDGYGVINRVRQSNERVPILVLSAKDTAADKIKCLEEGVDDYLSKPFNLDEFLLRVERLLTRSEWGKSRTGVEEELYAFGQSLVDLKRGKASGPGGEFHLTEQEMKLLKVFFSHEGVPIARAKLLEQAWGYAEGTSTRTVDNFLVRFRKYFEPNPKKPEHFRSVRGIGYLFVRNPKK